MALTSQKPFPIAQSSPDSPFAESYRTILANIELRTSDTRTVVITSSRPGEGKTSTAANLAIVSAQAGKRVLIVDSHLRHPKLESRFQIVPGKGLADVLRQHCDLQDAIVGTDVTGLHLLGAGSRGASSSSLLNGLTCTSLVGKCRSKYDLVIFDTPPVLTVSDALFLSRHVDGVIFVVDAKTTNRSWALRALNMIQNVNGTILGTVLNRIPKGEKDYNYYYDQSEK